MRNAGLDEAQAGIKIARRNINNLRYADDTILIAESKELEILLRTVKEDSEKIGLKLNIQKTKIMASIPITSWQIDGEKVETATDFIFLVSKITEDGDCNQEIKRHLPTFSLFSTSSTISLICGLFNDGHSDWCDVIPHCSFDLHFFNNERCQVSFHVFIGHLYIFFGEMSVYVFCPFFKNWVVCFPDI